jgi:putative peptide zinc metalloprotease protein
VPSWRRTLVLLAGATAVAGTLALYPVKSVVVAGYTYSAGELRIVTPIESSSQVNPGDHVALTSQGMFFHELVARATIGTSPPSESTAPLQTIVAVTYPGTDVSFRAYPGDLEHAGPIATSGRAEISTQNATSLGQWLWNSTANSPLWPGRPLQSSTDPTKGNE